MARLIRNATIQSICFLVFLVFTLAQTTFSQTSSLRTGGASEPPEFTGEPKKVVAPDPALEELFEIIGHLKDQAETRSSLPKLNEFIAQHSDYSDAYFVRATCEACILDTRNFPSIETDVRAAILHASQPDKLVYNKSDYYSLLAKIALATGQHRQAVEDLEVAMTRNLDAATHIFNIEGIAPERTSKFCTWNLTDLDGLVTRFPKDYRVRLLRGLYYEFFTIFRGDYYQNAMQEFQKAGLLNPRSPLPQYYIGRLRSTATFWTRKAWSSDKDRDALIRSAVQAYTKAIQLDAKFLPAYENRASAYLNLKQYSLALKDYDRILTLDPENTAAYADRGLAKLENGQYMAAIFDFDDAIRRKKDSDSYSPTLYENKGDAHMKLHMPKDAISDYSKAIGLQLGKQTILLNLQQIRSLYPEYDQVPDDSLCGKIHDLFWPQMEYSLFAKRLMEDNGKWQVSLLNELYEKRGDAYLRAGDFRRGVLDFVRIFKGIPNFADSTDRWRTLGKSAPGVEFLIDVKSAEFPGDGTARIWIKMTGKKESQTIQYEMDCNKRRMNELSAVTYNLGGEILSNSGTSAGWQQIIPDTIGEQLYSGACPASR